MKQFTKEELCELIFTGIDNALVVINQRMNEPEVIDHKALVYPKKGTEYWYLTSCDVQTDCWDNDSMDETRYDIGNHYATEEEAKLQYDWQLLNVRILNTIASLNKGDNNWVVDWKDGRLNKYTIGLDRDTDTLVAGVYNSAQYWNNNHYLSFMGKEKLLTLYTKEQFKFWLTKERA